MLTNFASQRILVLLMVVFFQAGDYITNLLISNIMPTDTNFLIKFIISKVGLEGLLIVEVVNTILLAKLASKSRLGCWVGFTFPLISLLGNINLLNNSILSYLVLYVYVFILSTILTLILFNSNYQVITTPKYTTLEQTYTDDISHRYTCTLCSSFAHFDLSEKITGVYHGMGWSVKKRAWELGFCVNCKKYYDSIVTDLKDIGNHDSENKESLVYHLLIHIGKGTEIKKLIKEIYKNTVDSRKVISNNDSKPMDGGVI